MTSGGAFTQTLFPGSFRRPEMARFRAMVCAPKRMASKSWDTTA